MAYSKVKFLIILFFIISIKSYSQNKWNRIETKHFEIYIENQTNMASISLELERIHNLFNINLSPFAPWMKREKTIVYIYSSYDSYINSQFKPPKWSKGLSLYEKKTIVVYNSDKKDYLIPTISHELTHLYFESYFAQKLKKPPLWLNEGLAVYMEDKSYEGEKLWERALKYSPLNVYIKFDSFFKVDVNKMTRDEDIVNYYLQAYGIVRYLYSPTKRISFYKFCEDLLNGKKLEKSLWDNYRISDYDNFEKRWFNWLNNEIIKSKNNIEIEFKPFKRIEFKN